MFHKQNGNVLVYILIAVALLAALTYTVTGEHRGQQQNQLTESRTKLLASDLISHANSAEIAFKQMELFGVEADQVLFDLPGTTDYNTNVTRQIYHPSGGGLGVFNPSDNYFSTTDLVRGWSWQNLTNVDWSPTPSTDLILTFMDLPPSLCEAINYQIYSDITIPNLGRGLNSVFTISAPNYPLSTIRCPDCDGKKNLCVINQSGTAYAFYNIIGSR